MAGGRVPGLGHKAADVRQLMQDQRPPNAWIREHGEDMPEIDGRRHQVHDVVIGFIVVALTAVPALAFLLARAQYSQSVAECESELDVPLQFHGVPLVFC
ncbi:hypothetical protein [Yinghuangia sp. YIM S09857]|uniref:hypothetical protein n=1 Tax=Yinghuangia sp. YIM S09857 TaxID=3436929 RepID=UPI003F532F46